ncbi:hypothetical protein [Acinetobacter sp.]|uniref:hypothetical protein n=1 Tax=Acinetobacter sp. TaxID=472 RepID=UPI003D034717
MEDNTKSRTKTEIVSAPDAPTLQVLINNAVRVIEDTTRINNVNISDVTIISITTQMSPLAWGYTYANPLTTGSDLKETEVKDALYIGTIVYTFEEEISGTN